MSVMLALLARQENKQTAGVSAHLPGAEMAVAMVVSFHADHFHSADNHWSNTEININCRVKYAMCASSSNHC